MISHYIMILIYDDRHGNCNGVGEGEHQADGSSKLRPKGPGIMKHNWQQLTMGIGYKSSSVLSVTTLRSCSRLLLNWFVHLYRLLTWGRRGNEILGFESGNGNCWMERDWGGGVMIKGEAKENMGQICQNCKFASWHGDGGDSGDHICQGHQKEALGGKSE